MKKLAFLYILIAFQSYSQTILIEPGQITKSKATAAPDDFLLTSYSQGTTLNGQYKSLIPASVINNFSIKASGYDGTAFENAATGSINFKSIEDNKSPIYGGTIQFYTTKNNELNTTSKPPSMAITPVGYLQIGHLPYPPFYNLNIFQDIPNESAAIKLQNITHPNSSTLLFQNGGGSLYNLGGTGIDLKSGGSFSFTSEVLNFNDVNGITQFKKTAEGNIGIGANTVPSATTKLKVSSGVSGINSGVGTIFEDDASHYVGIFAPNGFETGLTFGKPTLGPKSGGIIYTGSENMDFRTGGNITQMTISKTGTVGVGVFPVAKFHIGKGSSTLGAPIITNARPMVIEANANNNIVLAAPDNNTSAIYFERPLGVGSIEYNLIGHLILRAATSKMTYTPAGNLGIGAFNSSSPTAKVHVDGDFALKKIKIISGGANHHNLDRNGASVISVANAALGGANEDITGFAGGVDGLIMHVYPVQGTSITLIHEDTFSNAANRILTHTATNVTLTNNGGVTLIYDGSVSRWRIVSIAN
jgi:hypothetical protein